MLEPRLSNILTHEYLSSRKLTASSTVGAIPTRYLWSGTIGQMRRCLGPSGVGSERNSMRRLGVTIGTQSWPCWCCAVEDKVSSYSVKHSLMCQLPCRAVGAYRGRLCITCMRISEYGKAEEKRVLEKDARAWAFGAMRGTLVGRRQAGREGKVEGSLPQDMAALMATLSSPPQ